jgi:UDP-N-acetyl-D-galactosamine dehydrogenase
MLNFGDLEQKREKIAVVGLGYVGLPLAVTLGEKFQVLGFDVSQARIKELQQGRDRTGEVEESRLGGSKALEFTDQPQALQDCRLIIVAVPTPIDKNRRPDLGPTKMAAATVGQHMPQDCVVVFESTVYPGLTQEVCVPLLEEHSGLICGQDFSVGYSPERINPGDKEHTLQNIVKIVAGWDQETLELLDQVYSSVVIAGVHRASSIKVAEAAKVIENTQRDLNIALMNELALIFQRLEIDTLEVLQAAGSKWNFLPFRPGLVGGHCIGVDPYYLTFKAEALDYHPQVILAGRRINDSMGEYVAAQVVKRLIQLGRPIHGARVGVLGLTFKENVPDLRNTRVIDIVHELEEFCVKVLVHDALADPKEARQELGLELTQLNDMQALDAVILAVPHQAYQELTPSEIGSFFRSNPGAGLLADLKGALDREEFSAAGFNYWRI